MVLFFRGDFSFCFADSLSCRMAASATGSVPFSTSSSEKKGLFQRGEGKTGKNRAQTGGVCLWLKIHRNGINTINIFQFTTRPSGLVFPSCHPFLEKRYWSGTYNPFPQEQRRFWKPGQNIPLFQCIAILWWQWGHPELSQSWRTTVLTRHKAGTWRYFLR